MGLEHPHWAAMSAWAASQPMREHLLSRGLYRFGGSVVGVVYAVALVLLAQDSLWVLAFGLALWVALCAFLGNLQRGYLVYGCMLAGYSAAMVVVLHHGPADSVWPLAWDRMLTVITGVAAALCISWCFAPRRKAAVLIAQSRSALAQVLQATVAQLRQQSAGQAVDEGRLLSRLAQVEELLELYPEGSRTARNTSRAMHWQQHYAMELVYQLAQAQGHAGADPQASAETQAQLLSLCDAVDQLAQAMYAAPHAQGANTEGLNHALHQAIRACEALIASWQDGGKQAPPGIHALYLLLQAIRRGLRAEALDLNLHRQGRHSGQRGQRGQVSNGRHANPLALHRDWVGAREAALRAGGTLLVFGMVWAWTGSSLVAFGMLGLSVMLLVFSAFESPSHTMAFVLRGQLIGAALALLCQSWVWPFAQSSWQMVWMLLPFALMGGLVFAHKRTAAGAMDTNMAMFILLAPVFPATGSFGQHLSMALVVVSGPALAWVVYRWVYPTNGQRRLQTLARMMVQEVPDLAHRLLQDGKPAQWQVRPVYPSNRWQVQLHHRLLRLVRWAEKTQWPERALLPRMALSLRTMP
ncbi:MAG: FUSC family protein, partial [Comamonas sp.]